MTKKDYELIAASVKMALKFGNTDNQSVEEVARQLMYDLHKSNPRFDKAKFLQACGFEQGAYVNNKGRVVSY